MIRCKDCGGKGWTGPVHVHKRDGKHEWHGQMDCFRCGGSGKISEAQAAAQSIGRLHTVERVARSESLGECSRRLGISAADLSAYEHGRVHVEGYARALDVVGGKTRGVKT